MAEESDNPQQYEPDPEVLDRFKQTIHESLKRSRPQQLKQLTQGGHLEKHLNQQAQLATSLVGPALEAGLGESTAFEYAYPILYPESEQDYEFL